MMRRGQLARHRVDDLLRAAAAERLTGGIELDGGTTICLYLEDGDLYLATRAGDEVVLTVDDDFDDAAYENARRADEERLRASSSEVLVEALARTDGWYFFHELTDHPAQGLWRWPMEDLLGALLSSGRASVLSAGGLAEARVLRHRPEEDPVCAPEGSAPTLTPGRAMHPSVAPVEPAPPPLRVVTGVALGPHAVAADLVADADVDTGEESAVQSGSVPADSPEVAASTVAAPTVAAPTDGGQGLGQWRLNATPPTEPWDANSWAVMVAIAGAIDQTTVCERLGWSTEQAQTAFGGLVARGVLLACDPAEAGELIGGRVRSRGRSRSRGRWRWR